MARRVRLGNPAHLCQQLVELLEDFEQRLPPLDGSAEQPGGLAEGLERTRELAERATRDGATLVAFPETWLPGYPFHVWLGAPAWSLKYSARYYANSLSLDSAEFQRIAQAARTLGIFIALGYSERSGGSLYLGQCLIDDKGEQVKEAGPSMPVEVLGLGGVPNAGDHLTVVENEQRAREVAEYRQQQATAKRTATAPANLDAMFAGLKSDMKEYPVVVKADVQGSAEAIVTALHNLSNDEITLRVLNSGVGAITESDVVLASASKAPIIGFNVRPEARALQPQVPGKGLARTRNGPSVPDDRGSRYAGLHRRKGNRQGR